MIPELVRRPIPAGGITFLLVVADWTLTILQARAATGAYREHWGTYPVDTVEGNPLWQKAVGRRRFLSLKHLAAAVVFAGFVSGILTQIREPDPAFLFLGVAWGSLLLVLSVHLGNLVSYAAATCGVHGRILVHQRTAYAMTAGRYGGLALLLVLLAAVVPHPFLIGVAAAALFAVLRQLVARRRVPPIEPGDPSP